MADNYISISSRKWFVTYRVLFYFGVAILVQGSAHGPVMSPDRVGVQIGCKMVQG